MSTLFAFSAPAAMRWLGVPSDLISTPGSEILGSHFFSRFAGQVTAGLFIPFLMFFLLLLFVEIVRKEWISLGLLWVVAALLNTLVSGDSLTNLPLAGFTALILNVLLYRYGLLALITAIFVAHLWVFFPITTELRAWYAFDFVVGALLCVGLATWGFYTSLAGQKLFAGNLLDD